MTADPAVRAAAEALTETPCVREFGLARYGNATADEAVLMAEAAVVAARPIIEAEVRERIAADIEALPPHVVLSRRAAAQIARGTA